MSDAIDTFIDGRVKAGKMVQADADTTKAKRAGKKSKLAALKGVQIKGMANADLRIVVAALADAAGLSEAGVVL